MDSCHYSGSFSIMGNDLNFAHVPGAMKSWPKLGKLPIDKLHLEFNVILYLYKEADDVYSTYKYKKILLF